MKKIILTILLIMLSTLPTFANLSTEQEIQTKIDEIGTNILNSNKVQAHIVFTYNRKSRRNVYKMIKGIKKNQIIMYDGTYQYTETDDEIAAILSRQIYFVSKIYSKFDNRMNVAKNPRFYEQIIDKKAVDYMVNANYNPLALITYLNKTYPEYRYSLRHNRTNDRLIAIYEYILLKYPQYLNNDNQYIDNPYYQNFLLNTVFERGLLRTKLNRNSIKDEEFEDE
ncbi:hypothetical protein J6P92_05875 [bacterium]|nr:hypothetical protein [bacterium]